MANTTIGLEVQQQVQISCHAVLGGFVIAWTTRFLVDRLQQTLHASPLLSASVN